MIDQATGRLEAEALEFFDWCREMFERLQWDEESSQSLRNEDFERQKDAR
jgi:hypothetical protein